MSITVPECYEYIVGLSRTNCDCYTVPVEASISYSDLYIDELGGGLSFIQSITNCDNNDDLWELIERARATSITTFQADTNALLQGKYRLKRSPYYGGVGRAIAKTAVTTTAGDYVGVRMRCADVISGLLVIKHIGTLFNDTGVVALDVYNNLGELVDSINLNTTANTHTLNDVTLELPLHNNYIDNLEYFFVYQVGAVTPKGNDLKCSCGAFKPVFSIDKPYYWHTHEKAYGWADWMMVGGFRTTTVPDYTDYTGSTNNYLYGLTFDIELKCKVDEVLCRDQLDFTANNLAGAMAIAIQHKAGAIIGQWILSSGNLNRYTMINTEQIIDDVAKWNDTYNTMVKYIVDNVDISANDCLECKDVWELAKRGIFS